MFVRIRLKVMFETICILSSAEDNALYCFGRFVIALFILNSDRSMLLHRDIWISMHYYSKICKKILLYTYYMLDKYFRLVFILFNIFLSVPVFLPHCLIHCLQRSLLLSNFCVLVFNNGNMRRYCYVGNKTCQENCHKGVW